VVISTTQWFFFLTHNYLQQKQMDGFDLTGYTFHRRQPPLLLYEFDLVFHVVREANPICTFILFLKNMLSYFCNKIIIKK